ncbi:putative toxin-antitoxin system toxin component, PIN family [Synechococcus sp. CCY 0621]|uniref:putative toxin-antitoxin system toxin component, PIN family n=1 Tax=Synechococcus sp. CCY 0621 TaxID=2815603 RepID=UPI001C237C5C|nr:putative toxin-antitoxin system toxin component, PIN family [Synechococcus sp. CCY 0621]
MRLVLDTNTAISGLIWQGVPGQLIDAAVLGRVQLISTVPMLAELEGVLQRTKFREPIQRLGVAVADLFDGYAALVERVEPADLGGPVSRDQDDDDDLLALGSHQGIAIVVAHDAMRILRESGGSTAR